MTTAQHIDESEPVPAIFAHFTAEDWRRFDEEAALEAKYGDDFEAELRDLDAGTHPFSGRPILHARLAELDDLDP